MSNSMDANTAPKRTLSGARLGLRLIAMLAVTLGIVAISLWSVAWYQERGLRVAESYLNEGDTSKAAEALAEFHRKNPHHSGSLALQARILVEQGSPREAISLFERVGASTYQELRAWAKALLVTENWSQALPLLEYLLGEKPDDADLLHEVAACRAKLGDLDGALEAAEAFAKQEGFAARGKLLVGTIHHQRGNLRQVAAAWDEVSQINPEATGLQVSPATFFLEYGHVLIALGESELATEMIQRSVSLEPSADAYEALGEACFQLGEKGDAREAYQKSLSQNPNSIKAMTGLAQIEIADDPGRAIELLLDQGESPACTSEIAFLLQQAYARLGDEANALKWRKKAERERKLENVRATADQILKDTPESTWSRIIRAYRFAQNQNWGEAERLLKFVGEEHLQEPFIRSLNEAILNRGNLPPLEELPVRDL